MNQQGVDREIHIRGAREHNLKGVDVDIPLGGITVVTGPSGSGKTSLAMSTLYAEGQRRYVETFSPYVRQFMDRMDRPAVEAVENVPPAIALGQRNSVKNSRSTVGTMTGMNEYLKLIFSRMAVGRDAAGNVVRPATPQGVADELIAAHPGESALVCFAVRPVGTFDEMRQALEAQGYLRVLAGGEVLRLSAATEAELGMENWLVVQDRVKLVADSRSRLMEALETALHLGQDVAWVSRAGEDGRWQEPRQFRSDWYPLQEPRPGLFSGNSPLGACPSCKGYGRSITYDYNKGIIPDKTIADGALKMLSSATLSACYKDLVRANKRARAVRMNVPWCELTQQEQDWVFYGEAGDMDVWEAFDRGLWYGYKGIFDDMEKHAHKLSARVFLAYYRVYSVCPDCHGGRLRPESLAFTIGGLTVPQVQALPMDELLPWLDEHVLGHTGADRSLEQAVKEFRSRVAYLCEVGLGYIAASRLTRSLSGGEIERVSLTTCLGAALTETLFVLDEPTVGLHARDTARLIAAMRRLAHRGNTLVVVEHEEAVMRAADYLVDMGPGSGASGGELVYAGEPRGILTDEKSLTGQYLSGTRCIPVPTRRRKGKGTIRIEGAECHNLHDFTVEIPLGVYNCLTGVSGSGKSTLACQVLFGTLHPEELDDEDEVKVRRIAGLEAVEEVVLVDQSPIVRTPRSTPAVYIGVFEDIRALFVAEPAAQARGLKPGYFSFNSGDGRCPRCAGLGQEKVEMQFLSDIFVPCALCHGTRYTEQALSLTLLGYNMAEMLALDIATAQRLFAREKNARARRIAARLQVLVDVGLGHLGLGQPLNTLSGGENQRLKLAHILVDALTGEKQGKGRLLILDEPGTGLHFRDLEVLLRVFDRLVEQGNTLLVIEHNMELIKCADHVIDLGPEGGTGGGLLVAQGTPEEVASTGAGYTAHFLADALQMEYDELPLMAAEEHDSSVPAGVIALRGARHHQLKNIDVDIPRDAMTVVTGLSGSGKSTLAFDIIFAEGQKRFMDVMSPY
ncbi:MAG: excinuclease ABC subunit UvrA, partial [Akkermansia sp.]|nr:excinuclease ABC subunit UvrA [Akkermansia sp.]